MHGQADLQFAPLPAEKPQQPPPAWLKRLGEWLEGWGKAIDNALAPLARMLGGAWPVLRYVMLGLIALGLGYLVWRIGANLGWWQGRSASSGAAPEPAWTPTQQQALGLLEDADALAAQGRYDEAAHLLLLRSFAQIGQARPEWLTPASTAREMADLPALPYVARKAFAAITAAVEAGRYALRPLDHADWQMARAAYADFALQRLTA
ncbi:hypothetical protein GTZ99_13475 [Novosphingobium sp. FSY-8]|uniref:Protein-glutamine gamma-glutamyltransferase-like C-terminal domain-containing protein n=1 Tax=Novosphingobium ovatum TaxID=1908523 RepID=A0ABW9XG85_9SPHN|nr:hypothetical protein [Novosphingobium ovatum]